MSERIKIRSPHLAMLNEIGASGRCAHVVQHKGAGWVELCSKPTTFGGTCFGHARASEVIDVIQGLSAFFEFAEGES